MERIFVDTSAWYALVDSKDPDHSSASSFLNKNKLLLVTSDYIFAETLNLVKNRLGQAVAVKLGEKIKASSISQIMELTKELKDEGFEIFRKYKDKGFSYTDCTSFALMQSLSIKTAFGFDEHFMQFGMGMVPNMYAQYEKRR